MLSSRRLPSNGRFALAIISPLGLRGYFHSISFLLSSPGSPMSTSLQMNLTSLKVYLAFRRWGLQRTFFSSAVDAIQVPAVLRQVRFALGGCSLLLWFSKGSLASSKFMIMWRTKKRTKIGPSSLE
ncbi:hypothetical protein U1Q18_009652 [Sarracenia purpurea var. burkii]